MLNRPGIEESPGVKHHPGAQQLRRPPNLKGLCETFQTGEELDRIDKPLSPCQSAYHHFPGEPTHPHDDPKFLSASAATKPCATIVELYRTAAGMHIGGLWSTFVCCGMAIFLHFFFGLDIAAPLNY
jgi:hypothetical protein